LEYQETFQNLARLVVPRLADFCIIDIADEDGQLRQVAVAHGEAAEEGKLHQLREHYPATLTAKHGGTRVFQSGKSEMCCAFTEDLLRDMFDNEEDRALIRQLRPTSYIAVPLRARDRVLGAITMVNTSAERVCGANELSLAEELAQRAALALDNAGLYKAAQAARTEAERANLAKDRFLAMLSHELRTPLTPVLTTLLAMEHDGLPDSVQPSLQMIRRNVELEARLIDDLLDLTRISKGKVQLSLEIVDAHVLLRNALEICQSEIDQKRLALELELEAKRVHLEADPARLQQIFWNLIKNAVKFTPEGGRLTIRTANEEEEQFCIQVSDTGCGIDAETLPKIFKAFEQGERARLGGLGLGLAISKSLVETHHGKITAESPGRDEGATFTAVFPLSEEQVGKASNGASATPRERKSLRILLVEDHEDTNRSLTQLLRRRGYQVHAAHNVAKAVEVAASEEFDVLVSDIGLPDGSGVDVMQRLRGERPIFGIALTGFGMEEDIQRSHDGGFDHHLIKPVDLNRLDSIIQEHSAPAHR
jgi:signal transduction histidine kinase